MLLKTARKLIVLIIGGTVLLLGVVMIVTPGPGILGILGGLGILATEFVFARTLLNRMKRKMRELVPGKSPDSALTDADRPAQQAHPPGNVARSASPEVPEAKPASVSKGDT